ncbi:Dabb family protein [Microbacterium sp. LRZ72]|uniref:Dabb family protein n=1 Tax=Microbacterium sp. LRZ72 TaxID=2942481 RepID=UPI0029AB70C8|nr:Dabb family protein [Microbacterium sp. LRZ72]MDX2376028.1 Dabb family protein [Microbacterium sp. LRZ72]
MTLRHVVAWKLAAEDADARDEHARGVVARLQSLVGVVPSIRTLSAGENALLPGKNWDVALVADFDDAEGLAAYASHPAHLEVAEFIGAVSADRVAVDFEI